MDEFDVIIVGGGISGLIAAHALTSQYHRKVLLLEAENRLGGVIQTFQHEDFFLDVGAHALYNSYGSLLPLLSEIGLESACTSRKKLPYKMYRDGQISALWRGLHYFRCVLGYLRMRWGNKQNQTLKSFYTWAFGSFNYKWLLKSAFNGVLCQNSDEFPAELLFKKYPMNKRFPRAFSFHNGMETLIHAFVKRTQYEIQLNACVNHIQKRGDGEGWVVQIQKSSYQAKAIMIATSPSVAASLLHPTFFSSSSIMIQVLSAMKMSYIWRYVTLIKRASLTHIPEMSGMIGGLRADFYSMVSGDAQANSNYRGMVWHFKLEYSEFEIRQKVATILNINAASDIIKIEMFPACVPQLDLKSYQSLRTLTKTLPHNLSLVGNYWRRLSISDCAMRALSEAKRIEKGIKK